MSLRTIRQYAALPSLPTRGPLPPMVSVIIPLARTNLITNPSFETNTTGWTGTPDGFGGASLVRTQPSYHGVYGCGVAYSSAAANQGAYYTTGTLAAGTLYAFSLKFLDADGSGTTPLGGRGYKLSFATTGGVLLATYRFVSTGRWQWVWVLWNETSNAARRLYITRDGTEQSQFYIDGAQLEAITDGVLQPTTYIDGDQQGLIVNQQPPAYLWNGTPHASTSTRSALTRAGGYLVNLSAYNFLLTGIIGLGIAAPNNVSIPYTVLDGARYLRTTKPPRTISLPGRFQADDWWTYQQGLSAMRAAFDRDLVGIQQPLKLVVEPQDECGNAIGDFATVPCLYAGGLEGNDSNLPMEDAAPAFVMYVPYLAGGDSGAGLGVQQSVANANRILQRSPSGVWAALSTGASTNDVLALARGLDGKIYIGGRFAQLGAVANTAGIGYWDPADSAFHAMGTGVTTGTVSVTAIAVAPDGTVTVGGDFSTMGGVANTLRLAKWSGSAWSALATGVNGQVRALAFGPTGLLYLGGAFTNAGGVAAADSIASWNGAAFAALGTGSVGAVNALVVDATGTLYAGGVFTAMGGVVGADIVARWDGTWHVVGGAWAGGGPTAAYSLAAGANGTIYVGGDFTTAGGTAATRMAAWNGTAWSAMGTGMNGVVYSLDVRGDGAILAGGAFTTVSGITYPDGLAVWTGSVWTPMDVDLPGVATVFALLVAPDTTIYVGYNTAGSAISGTLSTVVNPAFGSPGIGVTYPTLVITGPATGTSRIFQLINTTTGIGIFLNYTINAGEVATFILDPVNPSYMSTFLGNIQNTILPGSQPSLLALTPGSNTISFYAADSTVVATLFWQKRYNGLADLVN
jgi:hypothetical protein